MIEKIHANTGQKIPEVAILILGQSRFHSKGYYKRKRPFKVKGPINQKNITTSNSYAPNTRVLKYIK